jgi:hypothetical protein
VFIDKLALPVTAQQHTKIVEPGDHTLKFDTVDQEHGHRDLVLANMVQECILQVLFVSGHAFAFFICGLLLFAERLVSLR